jgi:hypothetical protein
MRHRFLQRNFGFIILMGWLCGAALFSSALAGNVSEYDLKAAFLFNFAAFIEWPDPPKPLHICVYGDNPFSDSTIDLLLRQRPGNIDVDFEHLQNIEKLTACHILFVERSDPAKFAKVAARLGSAPVLVVTEMEGSQPSGSMINLLTESGHVTFDIDQNAALAAGLQISSRLLRLAKTVHRHTLPSATQAP